MANILIKKADGSICYMPFCDAYDLTNTETVLALNAKTGECNINLEIEIDKCKAGNDPAISLLANNDGAKCKVDLCTEFNLCNVAPVANAGTDQEVRVGTEVTLSGNGTDEDGTIVSYRWEQVEGETVTFDTTLQNPSFTPTVPGTYKFKLYVTDDFGAESEADEVIITITPNQIPVAVIADVPPTNMGGNVDLDGSGSSDPDGTIASYEWVQCDSTGITLAINNADQVNASFTAPTVTEDTTFKVCLVVTDNDGAESVAAEKEIVIKFVANQAPTATISDDKSGEVTESETIQLSAVNPVDPEGHGITYNWSFVDDAGLNLSFDDNTSQTPSIVTPSVTEDTDVTVKLTICDDQSPTACNEYTHVFTIKKLTCCELIVGFTETALGV